MKYGKIIQYAAVSRIIVTMKKKHSYQAILKLIKSKNLTCPGVKTAERFAGMISSVQNKAFVPDQDFYQYPILITLNSNLKNPNPDLIEFTRKYDGIDIEGVFLIPSTST